MPSAIRRTAMVGVRPSDLPRAHMRARECCCTLFRSAPPVAEPFTGTSNNCCPPEFCDSNGCHSAALYTQTDRLHEFVSATPRWRTPAPARLRRRAHILCVNKTLHVLRFALFRRFQRAASMVFPPFPHLLIIVSVFCEYWNEIQFGRPQPWCAEFKNRSFT